MTVDRGTKISNLSCARCGQAVEQDETAGVSEEFCMQAQLQIQFLPPCKRNEIMQKFFHLFFSRNNLRFFIFYLHFPLVNVYSFIIFILYGGLHLAVFKGDS